MTNYFIRSLETGKLELHFDKATYMALPPDQKAAIKSNFLWAKSRNAWVSRSTRLHAAALDIACGLGLEDRGETGQRLTFAEQIEAKQERAEDRAERMADRARDAAAEAMARFNSGNVQAVRHLNGQPILVGHHSERRHRALLERADNDMRKGIEASDTANRYERRAATARETAEGAQYSDPAYLNRRIRECEKEIRILRRYLAGKRFGTAALERMNAEACGLSPDVAVSEADRQRWTAALVEQQDKLAFFQKRLATCGRTIYTRETLAGKTAVQIRGRWEPIVKLNPKTVSVPNICFPTAESQRKYALKYCYSEVQDAR